MSVEFIVFTKPWRLALPELAAHVAALGFAGVELPVRPGYPVTPEDVGQRLPQAVAILGQAGLRIRSVAGPTDAATIAACAECGVPLIRVCIGIPAGAAYLEHEAAVRARLAALVPLLQDSGVRIGIQNHSGRDFGSALAVRRLLEGLDPRHLGAVWDPAHCALAGEPPEYAADILWSHLCLLNLKNGMWQRTNGPEAALAQYGHYWTSGAQGLCSWPAVAAEARRRGYAGPVCLTAEYSAAHEVDRLIAADLALARSLWS